MIGSARPCSPRRCGPRRKHSIHRACSIPAFSLIHDVRPHSRSLRAPIGQSLSIRTDARVAKQGAADRIADLADDERLCRGRQMLTMPSKCSFVMVLPSAQRYVYFRLVLYTVASFLSAAAARCAIRSMNAAARSAEVIGIICPSPSISSRSAPVTFAASPLPCTAGSRIRSPVP
jgi:hypothetical protein